MVQRKHEFDVTQCAKGPQRQTSGRSPEAGSIGRPNRLRAAARAKLHAMRSRPADVLMADRG
jgi:hypothetical protein